MRYEDPILRRREAFKARIVRLKEVPIRVLVPNLVTLLALATGLTGIRMAIEGKLDLAVYAVVAAIVLDGIDGRLARFLKGTSRFGAELDSLADFMNFGVAPGLLLYLWGLHDLGNAGWIGSLILAIAAALRLARFNVAIDAPDRPAWAGAFFTGVPAPAGAMIALLPLYLSFLGTPRPIWFEVASLVFTLVVAALMVSRVPTWSLKTGSRIHPDWVAPLLILAAGIVALLVSFPWWVMTVGSIAYIAALPLGVRHYRRLVARDERAKAAAASEPEAAAADSVSAAPAAVTAELQAD
jgi:CDP-diacylglycerol--serine O-phosphatidyltransferase